MENVKIGLQFDLRNPQQFHRPINRVYDFAIEVCQEAERLGIDSVWLSEHHLFADGYLPRPLTMAAAVAARTKSIRIGTAILLGPLQTPAALAEDAAVVDILSNGRLELGLGAGYRVPEFELYGADLKTRYSTNDDRAREIRHMWSAASPVTPKPIQDRIPIWMGYGGPQGARRAGLLGEGLLTPKGEMWPHYKAGLEEAGHDLSIARMGGSIQGFVSDDPERDWPIVREHVRHMFDSYRAAGVEGTDFPAPRPVDPERLLNKPESSSMSSFAYGTADVIADHMKRTAADAPVDTVFLWASIAGMPEDMVMRHVQTIATQLKPLLA